MQYKVKENFLIFRQGEVISEETMPVEYREYLPMYLSKGHIEEMGKEEKPDFDFNKDGKVDEKDVKLGAQIMAKKKGRPKKGTRR